MQHFLFVSCSPKGSGSISQVFAHEVLERLCAQHPMARVTYRAVSAAPPAFIDAAFCGATPTARHSPRRRR
jgi:FMN-dependent NADH-azoreductase